MVLNTFVSRFVVSTVLAERQGVTDPAVRTRLALIGGMLGSSATGLVVTSVLARREAESDQSDTDSPNSPSTTLVQVPDVTNKSFEEAQTLLKSPPLNFKVERQEAIVIDKPDDVVVFQVPSAGSRPIRVGSTITVFVNRKPRLPAQGLPNVIGETFDEAKRILEPLEVTISAIDVDSNATKGSVIMQNPDPGTAIAKGDAITLLVSTGRAPTPELVNLPDVIGKSRKEAEQTLRSIGFEVKVETLTVDEPSVVKEQNPKGGDYVKLPKGTSVTLKVGSNPPVVR